MTGAAQKGQAMPSTAPAVNGTPTFRRVSLRYIDFSGDLRSDSIDIPTSITPAQIQAYVAATAALTNASLYEVQVSDVYASVPDSGNAVNEPKDSAYDNLVIQSRNALRQSKRGFIPAPVQSLFITNTDQIDPTNADLATYLTAFLVLAGAGYSIVGARYTERREINEQVRF